jgi:hypothetical protein
MIRFFTTRIEDKDIHEVTTRQDDSGAITHVGICLAGTGVTVTALEASAIAAAINDHLGNRDRY